MSDADRETALAHVIQDAHGPGPHGNDWYDVVRARAVLASRVLAEIRAESSLSGAS